LREDHVGLRKGAAGAIIEHGTIKRQSSISPDPSGDSIFVVFDDVIGRMTIPTKLLEKVTS
jgi:hypothetical protein